MTNRKLHRAIMAERQLPVVAAMLDKVGQILITPKGYSIVARAEEVMKELTELRKAKRDDEANSQ